MDAVLVAVSVKDIHPAPAFGPAREQLQDVIVCGKSMNPEVCFTKTFRADAQLLDTFKRLEQHGSIVVALDEQWQQAQDRGGNFFESVVQKATDKLKGLSRTDPAHADRVGYDDALAHNILELLEQIYPGTMPNPAHLKHAFGNVPSDRDLFAALDALLGEELISGVAIRNDIVARKRLTELLDVQITLEGRKRLTSAGISPVQQPSVIVHGDHITNHGIVGAIGRHAAGSVTNGGALSEEGTLAALDALLAALEPLQQEESVRRAHLDLTKVRDELLDQFEPDQPHIIKWLNRARKVLAATALSHDVFELAQNLFAHCLAECHPRWRKSIAKARQVKDPNPAHAPSLSR